MEFRVFVRVVCRFFFFKQSDFVKWKWNAHTHRHCTIMFALFYQNKLIWVVIIVMTAQFEYLEYFFFVKSKQQCLWITCLIFSASLQTKSLKLFIDSYLSFSSFLVVCLFWNCGSIFPSPHAMTRRWHCGRAQGPAGGLTCDSRESQIEWKVKS